MGCQEPWVQRRASHTREDCPFYQRGWGNGLELQRERGRREESREVGEQEVVEFVLCALGNIAMAWARGVTGGNLCWRTITQRLFRP